VSQPATNSRVFRFGLFELDLIARELRKSGVRIKLQEQPFLILQMLVERPGAIVTREELKRRLWSGDTFVDFDLSLNSAVKKLRQALNDDSENPRFVETLYRRGYRFIGPINGSANGETRLVSPPPASAPSVDSTSAPELAPATFTRRTRLALYSAAAVLLLAFLALGLRLILSRPPRVLGFTQITHDGLAKGEMFTDGERLYFVELEGDRFAVSQVSVAGGETSLVSTSFENAFVTGVTSDGSSLLVGTFHGTGKNSEFWSVPLPSGAPRRVGDFVADFATWSPDASQLFFSRGPDIFQADKDGSQPRKLATVGSRVDNLRLSPDGGKLRFDVIDTRNGSSAIWELEPKGSNLHPLLPAWSGEPRECCGKWTSDGRYFLFQSVRDGRTNVWALREKSSWWSLENTPVQLTNGPLNFYSPTPSSDGKRVFTLGAQPRGELIRYDSQSGFVPYLGGISASDLAFSPDGQWVVYVSVPEGQLWKSKIDGSGRRPLTSDSISTGLPRWSPDGTQIVFMGATLRSEWRAYIISSDGTGMRELVASAEAGYDPNWSPDGKSVVLTLNDAGSPLTVADVPGIVVLDLSSGKLSPLPGAKRMFSPRWSPDGGYIAAITDDSQKLMLFDRDALEWQELVSLPIGYPTWSRDGKYLYFDTTLTEDAALFRVRISDRKLERLVGLTGMRRLWGRLGSWTGLTPDDSPLLLRDVSSQEIYAIDWQAP